MPAPPSSMIKSKVLAKMGPKVTGSEAFKKYIQAVTDEIATEWGSFIQGAKFGGLAVTGVGIGAWAGVGSGGKISADTLKLDVDAIMSAAGFTKKTPPTIKILTELSNTLGKKFDGWVSSYKFAGVPFVGASTATPLSPGVFTANSTPLALLAVGVGTPPSGIQSAWEANLSPDFKLDNPHCSTRIFTSAIGSTVEELFTQFFLANTLGLGNSATGPATPGVGAGIGNSANDGKLV